MKLLVTGDYFISESAHVNLEDNLKRLFEESDYRVVNYEGPVWSDDFHILPAKSGPRLMQSTSGIQILRDLKVDALTLANNHIMDQGVDGYNKTVGMLDGFSLIGAGTWDEAYCLKVIETDGFKVGLINLCEMQFGMLADEWTQGDDVVGCAWVNHKRVNQLITESKRRVDCLVAIVHAGVEMTDVPLPEWRDRYREMIELGCDAVIAHHTHTVQGYEIYKEKPIAYSLGNFCFSDISETCGFEWHQGAMAILDISKDGIVIDIHGCRYQNGILSLVDREEWDKTINKLCSYLSDDVYMDRVNESCRRLMTDYWNLFAMGGLLGVKSITLRNVARILAGKCNRVHLLNNIRCESHRWCICRALDLES